MIALDLFSGAGGMSLGFEEAGFDIRVAVEIDSIHAATYQRNFPSTNVLRADIRQVDPRQLLELAAAPRGGVDVMFGGPPCQGFSVGGLRGDGDPRNELLFHFARLTGAIRPKYFVLENVPGLAGTHWYLLHHFIKEVRSVGYEVVDPLRIVDARDFGVPQRRRRLMVLGYRRDQQEPEYPVGTVSPETTVRDAIGDLVVAERDHGLLAADRYGGPLGKPSHYSIRLRNSQSKTIGGFRRTSHGPDVVARFSTVKAGARDRVSRFLRLPWDAQAPTLRAGTDSARGSYTAPRPIHPTFDRCITVREAARIHSFPDSFEFHPTVWHGFRQVGNSVPPLLAEAVARQVADALAPTGTRRLKLNEKTA